MFLLTYPPRLASSVLVQRPVHRHGRWFRQHHRGGLADRDKCDQRNRPTHRRRSEGSHGLPSSRLLLLLLPAHPAGCLPVGTSNFLLTCYT
ncbi:hypothetical protein E2C01_092848 [Portunus trituberculatus]|uniref:Uncharacterized protein n=1 Tax=Portunus trituberculatus TaxID=210409 RepID=A0A5B7JHI5_PORTR|nr:hypothetical protein [Portunus trituberculatus]